MKRVLVSVKSVQRDMDGKDTVVELISPGTSHEKGNAQYVRYEESSVTGLDGVKTTIKIHDDVYCIAPNRGLWICVINTSVVKSASLCMKHRMVIYTWPWTLNELTVDFHEGVGHVHLGYDISVEGEWQFYNQLDIDVREDTEHGNEGNPEIGIGTGITRND